MARSGEESVIVEPAENVITVRLNKPDRLNAVDDAMVDRLIELVETHRNDGKGLVITGEGRATCAGRDTTLVSQPEWDGPSNNSSKFLALLGAFPQPTMFAAKGAVVGFGFAAAIECDFIVLGADTHFSFPEIDWGINTPGVVSQIAQWVGPRIAKEIVMTGKPVDPEHAYNLGLVNRVVPEEDVEDTAFDLIGEVMKKDERIVADCLLESRLST